MKKIYRTNFKVAVEWLNNNYILCNNIPNVDPSVWDNVLYPSDFGYDENEIDEADDEEFENDEIYQWFLTDANNDDVDYLRDTFGLTFTYSDMLDCFILCVTHYGTAWHYVDWATTNKNAERKLGEKK